MTVDLDRHVEPLTQELEGLTLEEQAKEGEPAKEEKEKVQARAAPKRTSAAFNEKGMVNCQSCGIVYNNCFCPGQYCIL